MKFFYEGSKVELQGLKVKELAIENTTKFVFTPKQRKRIVITIGVESSKNGDRGKWTRRYHIYLKTLLKFLRLPRGYRPLILMTTE